MLSILKAAAHLRCVVRTRETSFGTCKGASASVEDLYTHAISVYVHLGS